MVTELLSKRFRELPMLESLLSDFAKSLQEKLIKFLALPVELAEEAILTIKSFDYPKQDYQSVIAVEYNFANFNCNSFYLFLDRAFLYKMIEITLGGQQLDYSLEVHNRQFSKIEEKIIDRILLLITEALDEIFTPLADNIKLVKKSVFLQNYLPTIKGEDLFLSRNSITIKDLVSIMDLVLPYDSIIPVKASLNKGYSNQQKIQSKVWEGHMHSAVKKTPLEVSVKISLPMTDLKDLQNLKVGDTIATIKTANEPLILEINGQEIFKGKLGSSNNKMALELI
jgi:flagellar motor switch protein FliM